MSSYELAACPACAATQAQVIATADDLRAEQEDLWRFQLRRRRTDVPPAQLYDRAFFSQDPALQIVQCEGCGTVYRNPREDPEQLVDSYAAEETSPAVYQELFDAQRESYQRQAEVLTKIAGDAGSGLEVGSYVGAFLTAAGQCGWQFEGVDVNASAVEFARSKGLTALVGTLAEVPTDRSYDAIAIWNCFDQLPDPRATLEEARLRLRAGGLIALRVPNGAFYSAWRKRGSPVARALLAYNNLLAFPYRQGFTPSSLSALLAGTGFELVRQRADVLVPTADRWTLPWARLEERLVKRAIRWTALSPWFELYARRK